MNLKTTHSVYDICLDHDRIPSTNLNNQQTPILIGSSTPPPLPEVLTVLSSIAPSLSSNSQVIQSCNFNFCDVIGMAYEDADTVHCSLCQIISHVKCVKSTLPSDFDPQVDNGDEIHWCCADCTNAPKDLLLISIALSIEFFFCRIGKYILLNHNPHLAGFLLTYCYNL